MTKSLQIYYNAIFGGIGGLLAWIVMGLIPSLTWDVHLANAFNGAGIGLFIGAMLGMVEGLLIKRTFGRTVIGLFSNGCAGLVSGVVGLTVGGILFVALSGGMAARILGWAMLGLCLGLGEGVVSRKFKRASYGLVGGALAGLVGGALYEFFTYTFLEQSDRAQMFLSAVGLIFVGMCLGSILPLSIDVIGRVLAERGVVIIRSGRRANTEIDFVGSATLGSSDACDVYIPDKRVDKQQAEIVRKKKTFQIRNTGIQEFFVDNRPVLPGASAEIASGAQILMGDNHCEFRAI